MADVLFVTWDGGGNVPPALGLAAELERRGHAVRFLGHPQQRAGVTGAGFGFTPYTHARPWSSTAPTDGLSGGLTIVSMFADRGPGVDLLSALEQQSADLVVLDCMSLGALQAAERAGLRRAVLVHTYYGYLTKLWARGPVGAYARLRGQRPTRLWSSADAVLVATDRELDPVRDTDLPPTSSHVGVVQRAPRERPPANGAPQSRVLVSLSTTYFTGQDRTLQAVLDALGELAADGAVNAVDRLAPLLA